MFAPEPPFDLPFDYRSPETLPHIIPAVTIYSLEEPQNLCELFAKVLVHDTGDASRRMKMSRLPLS